MTILSIPAKDESFHSAIILYCFDLVEIFRRQERNQSVSLADSHFERELSGRTQAIRRSLDQLAHEFVAALAAEESDFRIAQHFAGKRRAIDRRDIRKIGHDEIERAVD